jgi:ATP-binding cassette subfamily B (MDR/TAP) protein 1
VIVPDNAKDGGKKEELGPVASLSEMCMLAERDDYLLFFFGCLGAMINGTGDPLMMLFFSEGLQNLSGDVDDMYESMVKVAIMMCLVGLGLFFGAWLQYACFTALAKRMTQKLREEWFKAVVRQDVGWFDVNSPGEMPGRISSALVNYEEGIGSKFWYE